MNVSVKNAADEKQVKQAASNDEFRRDIEIRDLIDVLSMPQGRRVLWRMMEWSGCEGTPKRNDDALTYMAIGSGDVGRWLKSEIICAGEGFLFKMMEEQKGESDGRRGKGRNAGNRNTKGGDAEDGSSES